MKNLLFKLRYLMVFLFFHLSLSMAQNDNEGLIILISSGIKQPIEDALDSVTVIDRADIENLQLNSMSQVLNQVPGLSMINAGGYGSFTSLYMRGTNSNQTLVLIDGQRLSSATTGTSAIQFLEPEQVQRVEVARGAKASLYGADAIGGVINIITRTGHDEDNLFVSSGVGSFGTQKYALGVNKHMLSDTHLQLNLHYMDSQGFDDTPAKTEGNDDKDGYDNFGVLSSIEQRFSDWGYVRLGYLRNSGENDYDDLFAQSPTRPYQVFALESYQFKVDVQPTNWWHSILRLGKLKDNSSNKDHRVPATNAHFQTRRDSIHWQNDFTWHTQQVTTLAVDYYRDNVDMNSLPRRDTHRDNLGYLIQHQASFLNNDLQVSIRQDDNEDYGKNVTGTIAWGINVDPVKVVLSYGTGFRAPTFNDLYYPGFGNPTLKPELSRQTEVDVSGFIKTLSWQVNLYYNRMTDMIITVPVTEHIGRPENAGKVDIKGMELILSGTLKSLDWKAYYSFVDPVDQQYHRILPFRARNSVNLDLLTSVGAWDMGLTLSSRSKSFSYDSSGNSHKMGGFATVDIFATWHIQQQLTLKLKVTNLLDKTYAVNQYQVASGSWQYYNTAGVAGFASLVYRTAF